LVVIKSQPYFRLTVVLSEHLTFSVNLAATCGRFINSVGSGKNPRAYQTMRENLLK